MLQKYFWFYRVKMLPQLILPIYFYLFNVASRHLKLNMYLTLFFYLTMMISPSPLRMWAMDQHGGCSLPESFLEMQKLRPHPPPTE